MLIQVNTGHAIKSPSSITEEVQIVVADKLSRFANRITRAEIHLSDENTSAKSGGNDKRCQIEVRMAGMQPISVTDHADTYDQAVHGAVGKMQNLIETTLGKLESH